MRSVDHQGIAFSDRVRQRYVGNFEGTDFEAAMVFFDYVQLNFAFEIGFLKLAPHKFCRERGGKNRDTKIGSEVGNRTDMILVRMGQHDGLEIFHPFLYELEIGKDEIDAGVLATGKCHAQIDHEPAPLTTIQVDIHTDLARSPQC